MKNWKNLNETWDAVVAFYANNFGISKDLVELMSRYEVLKLCASGSSDAEIEEYLDLEHEEVVDILQKYYGHVGWNVNLKINPYAVYLTVLDADGFANYKHFKNELKVTSDYKEYLLKAMYKTCDKFYGYEERIKNDWV